MLCCIVYVRRERERGSCVQAIQIKEKKEEEEEEKSSNEEEGRKEDFENLLEQSIRGLANYLNMQE